MKCATKPYDSTHLTSFMLLHYCFENRLRFDKVKEVRTFLGHSVYFSNANSQNSVITIFGVGLHI